MEEKFCAKSKLNLEILSSSDKIVPKLVKDE